MRVIKEALKNYPEKAVVAIDASQCLVDEDEKVFDDRAEKVLKEISRPLDKNGSIDGAPKAIKPKKAIVPEPLKEEFDMNPNVRKYSDYLMALIDDGQFDPREVAFACVKYMSEDEVKDMMKSNGYLDEIDFDEYSMEHDESAGALESFSLLTEDINEENVGRVVHDVIRNMYGIDVEVATYKDEEESNCVIAQFIIAKDENSKMKYDDLKEELYKRLKDINISCKQFSSPNLIEKGVEYKLKLFIIKEIKDKKRNKRKKSRPKMAKVGQRKEHKPNFTNLTTDESFDECDGLKAKHVNHVKPSTIEKPEQMEEKILYDDYSEGLDTAFMHAYTN